MQRTFLCFASLVAAAAISSAGCRSCDSCHDYSPPVASCECGSCGTQRAGSASAGYTSGEYVAGEYVPGEARQQGPVQQ
jgi:hypothetical protein